MRSPNRPYATIAEREPRKDSLGKASPVDVSTVFLTASRCPIGCSMCDLHHNTFPGPTAAGAIPEQIRFAQDRLPRTRWIKLYNSGNFFDPASIPPADHREIAELCQGYERVIIENHPRFGRHRHLQFRDLLQGQLEIAVGLETVQPRVLKRLGKRMTRDDFDHYARSLVRQSIDLRVFLIVGAPNLSVVESVRWARLSVRHAVQCGARHVSLIPARAGHGWNAMAASLPNLSLEHLALLFRQAIGDLGGEACLSVDLWNVDRARLDPSGQCLLKRFESAILLQDANQL